jgi:hypothetical protein
VGSLQRVKGSQASHTLNLSSCAQRSQKGRSVLLSELLKALFELMHPKVLLLFTGKAGL